MIRTTLLSATLAALPLAASAQEETYHTSDGSVYVRIEGELVNLVSRGDATHAIGSGGEVTGPEQMTFSRDCSVTSTLLDQGTWTQTKEGILATFPDAQVKLPGQEFWSTPDACKS